MATEIGTLVKVKLGTKFFLGEMTNSISASATAIEISSKANGNESAFEYGRVAETATFSSLASSEPDSTDYGYKQAKAAMYAKTKVAYVLTEYDSDGAEVSGALKISGTCIITSVTKDAPDNDKMTFSMDVQFDGKTTDTTN
jgi:hypothetical protein